jgi:hypothetical protein
MAADIRDHPLALQWVEGHPNGPADPLPAHAPRRVVNRFFLLERLNREIKRRTRVVDGV